MTQFVSRAGEKLSFALSELKIDVSGKIAADFGASTGGFVDVLLQNGAEKVYAVEVGYGTVDWNLRNDSRVVVMERTNAMHVTLSEKVDVITIDCGWTKQEKILPNAKKNLKDDGFIISLIKPHYEAPELVRGGKLPEVLVGEVVEKTKKKIEGLGFTIQGVVESPIVGEKGGNSEYVALIALEERFIT
jgi:23S rRNA (cytidine1920-2'-O)/16S rRNA (cytidine1409-2'-O)-methyltransferase